MEIDDFFRSLRQGHIVRLSGSEGGPSDFVVVSQTCDVVLPKREFVQLAPTVLLLDDSVRMSAEKKENARYLAVSADGERLFADLAQIRSVLKVALFADGEAKGSGFPTELEARAFGLGVGRWFGRFAIPDAIQPCLAPLQKLVRQKYLKPDSALGRVLHNVAEIRVGSESWSEAPAVLTVHVIVKAGFLPTIPEDYLTPSPLNLPNDLNSVCEQIIAETGRGSKSLDAFRLSGLWSVFAQLLAARCKVRSLEVDGKLCIVVKDVTGEASSDDEFSLAQYRKSEQLDLDFLSDPAPF